MPEIAISVAGLGKRYRIEHQHQSSRITESLAGAFHTAFDRLSGGQRATTEWIWAVRDLAFEVNQGDVVGVIGRNGSGKTTLLKILSRITEPTAGSAHLLGRVGSLLEVGTGFHQELSGRENVYMSGAVLGMRRSEIDRNFDEIVEFSGVERFLDTPVKRYSSGMQVRLGFAVAAHLDPEILLVDEVLAVGDAEFQRKCLAKMSELGHGGRTILFVSHSLPSVLRLCERAILLDQGRLITAGETHEVVRAYLESDLGRSSERQWEDPSTAPGDAVVRLRSVRVLQAHGGRADEVDIREPIDIEVEYWTSGQAKPRPAVNLILFNSEGVCLFATSEFSSDGWKEMPREPGIVHSRCRIPGNFLAEGRVTVNVNVATYNPNHDHASEADAVAFQVVDRSIGDGVRGEHAGEWPGVMRPMLAWDVQFTRDS